MAASFNSPPRNSDPRTHQQRESCDDEIRRLLKFFPQPRPLIPYSDGDQSSDDDDDPLTANVAANLFNADLGVDGVLHQTSTPSQTRVRVGGRSRTPERRIVSQKSTLLTANTSASSTDEDDSATDSMDNELETDEDTDHHDFDLPSRDHQSQNTTTIRLQPRGHLPLKGSHRPIQTSPEARALELKAREAEEAAAAVAALGWGEPQARIPAQYQAASSPSEHVNTVTHAHKVPQLHTQPRSGNARTEGTRLELEARLIEKANAELAREKAQILAMEKEIKETLKAQAQAKAQENAQRAAEKANAELAREEAQLRAIEKENARRAAELRKVEDAKKLAVSEREARDRATKEKAAAERKAAMERAAAEKQRAAQEEARVAKEKRAAEIQAAADQVSAERERTARELVVRKQAERDQAVREAAGRENARLNVARQQAAREASQEAKTTAAALEAAEVQRREAAARAIAAELTGDDLGIVNNTKLQNNLHGATTSKLLVKEVEVRNLVADNRFTNVDATPQEREARESSNVHQVVGGGGDGVTDKNAVSSSVTEDVQTPLSPEFDQTEEIHESDWKKRRFATSPHDSKRGAELMWWTSERKHAESLAAQACSFDASDEAWDDLIKNASPDKAVAYRLLRINASASLSRMAYCRLRETGNEPSPSLAFSSSVNATLGHSSDTSLGDSSPLRAALLKSACKNTSTITSMMPLSKSPQELNSQTEGLGISPSRRTQLSPDQNAELDRIAKSSLGPQAYNAYVAGSQMRLRLTTKPRHETPPKSENVPTIKSEKSGHTARRAFVNISPGAQFRKQTFCTLKLAMLALVVVVLLAMTLGIEVVSELMKILAHERSSY